MRARGAGGCALIVHRAKGSSAAFIKDVMRRSAQFHLEGGNGDGVLGEGAVTSAFEEMVFAGGALNLKLLGGDGGGWLKVVSGCTRDTPPCPPTEPEGWHPASHSTGRPS